MLVLSRKIGERIFLGDEIEIVVTKVNGCRVTLGITAPQSVNIQRAEVSERKQVQDLPLSKTLVI